MYAIIQVDSSLGQHAYLWRHIISCLAFVLLGSELYINVIWFQGIIQCGFENLKRTNDSVCSIIRLDELLASADIWWADKLKYWSYNCRVSDIGCFKNIMSGFLTHTSRYTSWSRQLYAQSNLCQDSVAQNICIEVHSNFPQFFAAFCNDEQG